VCCSVLHCVAVCCSVLQCVAVCCSVLQCVAVCCSVLQCVYMSIRHVIRCHVIRRHVYVSSPRQISRINMITFYYAYILVHDVSERLLIRVHISHVRMNE